MSSLASWFVLFAIACFVLAIALAIMAGRSRQHDDLMTLQWLARQRLHAEQTLYDQDEIREIIGADLFSIGPREPRVVICRACRAPLRPTYSPDGVTWDHRSEALNRDHHATPMPGGAT